MSLHYSRTVHFQMMEDGCGEMAIRSHRIFGRRGVYLRPFIF